MTVEYASALVFLSHHFIRPCRKNDTSLKKEQFVVFRFGQWSERSGLPA